MSARHRSRRARTKPVPAPAESLGFGRRELAICAALVAAVALIYSPVATYGFVNWDDPEYVTNNPVVRNGISLAGLRWAFTTAQAANWHPVTWLSHMLDVQLFGLQAGWHHVTSVLLHLMSTLLLFAWLRRSTGAVGRSAVVAALFAVHPSHVESVAWVAERKDTLSTVFWMISLWAYTAYALHATRRRYFFVLASVALGLMAKPMLVTLPFVFLLLDIWPLRRLSFDRAEGGERPALGHLIMEKIPLLALAVVSSIATFIAQSRGGAVARLDAYPLRLRAVNALISYVAYVGETLWPARLAVVYPPRAVPPIWVVAAVLTMLALITALTVRAVRKRPYALVGWFWYLGTLIPVIGLVQVGSQPMADRYTYIPMIGLLIILSWGAHEILVRGSAWRAAAPIAASAALVGCALVAHAQVGYWRDDLTLWSHALAVTAPNARAHNNLGNALSDRGRVDDAITHYREAIKIDSRFGEAHSNLANALVARGLLVEAQHEYEAALRDRPTDPFAHNGLGSLLDDQGKVDEAIAHYKAALQAAPEMADVHNNLAVALTKQGRMDDAIREFLEAIRANPANANYHYNLGVIFSQRGDTTQARRHLEAAVGLNASFDAARRALGALTSRQ